MGAVAPLPPGINYQLIFLARTEYYICPYYPRTDLMESKAEYEQQKMNYGDIVKDETACLQVLRRTKVLPTARLCPGKTGKMCGAKMKQKKLN